MIYCREKKINKASEWEDIWYCFCWLALLQTYDIAMHGKGHQITHLGMVYYYMIGVFWREGSMISREQILITGVSES